MEEKTQIFAENGKQDIVITRNFDLPVELVFKAYEDPPLIEQWMGTKVLKMDNKKHGSYEFETLHDDKVVFRANGTIHEFVPNQRIVRTFEMENMPIGIQLEFLEFEHITNDSSKLTIHIIYKSEQHRAAQLKLPFAKGITMAHDRLQYVVKNNIIK